MRVRCMCWPGEPNGKATNRFGETYIPCIFRAHGVAVSYPRLLDERIPPWCWHATKDLPV